MSTTYRVLSDLLYRSVAIVTTANVVTETYDTDAYGNTLCYSGPGTDGDWFTDDDVPTNNPINTTIFTGRLYDAESQIYWYRARYYGPSIGRFISRDPIGVRGGINMYAYVGNSPVVKIDPWGLKGCENCGIKKGPEYNVSGTVPSGTVLTFTAEFLNDATHDPSCCEVRQLINWNKAPLADAPWGPAPHPGFKPPRNQPGEWYEDRDEANTRYGRRTGAPYADTDPGNGYSGNGYHGSDQPGGSTPIPKPGVIYKFRLIVVDICNGGKTIYTSKTVTVDRGQVP